MSLRNIHRLRNYNSTAAVPDTFLVSLTSATVTAANVERQYFEAWNIGLKDAWIKLQPALTDNDAKGIPLPQGASWRMSPDNIYTGEISVISAAGPSTTIAYEEY